MQSAKSQVRLFSVPFTLPPSSSCQTTSKGILPLPPPFSTLIISLSGPHTPTPVPVPQSPSLAFSSYSIRSVPDQIALSSNPRKRKDCPDDSDSNIQTDEKPTPHADEYGAGFVTCQTCGTEVSFRDEANAFTTKLWDAHRLTWSVTLSFSHL
jgi:hypothetical protein